MAEKKGRIVVYHSVNRLGEIEPEGTTLRCRFYLKAVSNPDPAPAAGDIVTFDAPEPRKSKNGKAVQGDATAVTITERGNGAPQRREREHRSALRKTDAGIGRGAPVVLRATEDRERRGARTGRGQRGEGRSRQPNERPSQLRERRQDAAGQPRDARQPRAPRSSSEPRTFQRRERNRPPRENMPAQPIERRAPLAHDVLLIEGNHPGLVLDRFFVWPGAGDAPLRAEERHRNFFLLKELLPASQRAQGQPHILRQHLRRQRVTCEELRSSGFETFSIRLQAKSRVVVGHSEEGPLGNPGVCFDFATGLPMIPAATLKGAVRSFLDELDESASVLPTPLNELRSLLVGSKGQKGALVFLDALPAALPIGIGIDIDANHHRRWYRDGSIPLGAEGPTLSYSLMVLPGAEFSVTILVDAKKLTNDQREVARMILKKALTSIALGGRRSRGYGRFAVARRVPTKGKPRLGKGSPSPMPEQTPKGTETGSTTP